MNKSIVTVKVGGRQMDFVFFFSHVFVKAYERLIDDTIAASFSVRDYQVPSSEFASVILCAQNQTCLLCISQSCCVRFGRSKATRIIF